MLGSFSAKFRNDVGDDAKSFFGLIAGDEAENYSKPAENGGHSAENGKPVNFGKFADDSNSVHYYFSLSVFFLLLLFSASAEAKDKTDTSMPTSNAAILNHASRSGKKLIAVAINGAVDPTIYLSKSDGARGKSGKFISQVLHWWRKLGYGFTAARTQREQKDWGKQTEESLRRSEARQQPTRVQLE